MVRGAEHGPVDVMSKAPQGYRDREFTVLVVDDEKDIAESAREVIEKMVPHCHVETAASCEQGIAALMRKPFDAVLVDYKMPHHTGLDFIREAHGLEPDVPAILMTAYGSIDLAAAAVNDCHVDGFLAKPIDAATLASAVEGALHRSTGQAFPIAAADSEVIAW